MSEWKCSNLASLFSQHSFRSKWQNPTLTSLYTAEEWLAHLTSVCWVWLQAGSSCGTSMLVPSTSLLLWVCTASSPADAPHVMTKMAIDGCRLTPYWPAIPVDREGLYLEALQNPCMLGCPSWMWVTCSSLNQSPWPGEVRTLIGNLGLPKAHGAEDRLGNTEC